MTFISPRQFESDSELKKCGCSSIGRMVASKTTDEGSSPYIRANSLVVQWIRTDGYGPSNGGSNPSKTTYGPLA